MLKAKTENGKLEDGKTTRKAPYQMHEWSPTWSDCLVDLSKVLLSQHRQMAQARVTERGGAGALGTVVRVVIPPAPAFLKEVCKGSEQENQVHIQPELVLVTSSSVSVPSL